MKRINLTFLCCLVTTFCFYSCQDIDIENNKRITVSGKVVDQDGNLLNDINVQSVVEEYTLGAGSSNASGDFSYVSLQSYSNDFVTLINRRKGFNFNQSPSINQNYATARIINYDEDDFLRVDKYELGSFEIPKVASLELTIDKISSEEKNLDWSLRLKSTNCDYAYRDTIEAVENSCYEVYYIARNQDSIKPDYQGRFYSLASSPAVFTYTINNGATQSITIPLTNASNNYVFEY